MKNSYWLEAIGTTIILVLLMLLLILGVVYTLDNATCNTLQKLNPTSNYQVQFWTGCMVQTPNGYWVSYDKYTPIEIVPSER